MGTHQKLTAKQKAARIKAAQEREAREKACRDAGKIVDEGKEYVVQDGDIMHFLFNV